MGTCVDVGGMNKFDVPEMSDVQKAAYVSARAAALVATIAAMQADNQVCEQEGRPVKYMGEDFLVVLQNSGCSPIDVLSFFGRLQ